MIDQSFHRADCRIADMVFDAFRIDLRLFGGDTDCDQK